MIAHPLVSPHDGVGTNLFGHVLRGKLMRVVPRDNEAINETWIADRDRFSYEGVYSADRLGAPLIRDAAAGRQVSWESALAVARGWPARACRSLGSLGSASATTEELYLLNRLTRGLGTQNVDHRLRARDFRDQAADALFPNLGMRDRGHGSAERPADHRFQSASRSAGARAPRAQGRAPRRAVAFVNPARFDYNFPVAAYLHLRSRRRRWRPGRGARRRGRQDRRAVPAHLARWSPRRAVTDAHRPWRRRCWRGRSVRCGWGPSRCGIRSLRTCARWPAPLRSWPTPRSAALAEGGNAAGAYLAGCVPHREAGGKVPRAPRQSAAQMFQSAAQGLHPVRRRRAEADALSPRGAAGPGRGRTGDGDHPVS